MFKKPLLLFFSTVLLTACATPEQMRQQTPFLSLKSSKSAKDVAICISSKWENLGIFRMSVPVNMRPTETGYVISISFTPTTDYLIDVTNTASGSQSKYYKRVNSYGESFDNAVKDCQ